MYEKKWGREKWICNTNLYCGKILYLDKDRRCSYHYHAIKDETFYLLKGHVFMVVDGKFLQLRDGDSIRIRPHSIHSFTGIEDSEILEVSTQHMEEDSYRKSTSGEAWTLEEWNEFIKDQTNSQ